MKIFTISLILFNLLLFSPPLYTQTPDRIYHNGIVITMEPDQPQAEAIAIAGDTISAVGPDTGIVPLAGAETQLYDLQGKTVLPGFNDSHTHWFSWREHRCEPTGEVTHPGLEEIMQMVSRNGWTSIAELNFGRPDLAPEHLNNALDLDNRGKLSVRLNGYWGTLEHDGDLIDVLADSLRTPGRIYSDRVRAPGVKIYVDNPFGDFDLWSREKVIRLVEKAHAKGWQIAAHAVNQSAVEKILTAYENVLGEEPNADYRHRIEHAVKVSDDQLDRITAGGIITSFQLLGPADWPTQETFADRFTGSNPEWVMRWKDLVEAGPDGARNAAGTDAPFNDAPCDYSPFTAIYQAVTRKGYTNRTLAGWETAQRLSVEQCLKLLTIDGAYATFEEDLKGSLAPGKWADLIIVSANPLQVAAPEDLLDIKILLTMVGGRIEYCDELSPFCAPVETFPIDDAVVTASNYLPGQTPDLAFDGDLDTNWGSGDDAPQYIQIDLMQETLIKSIDLVVDQWPAGVTRHQIWAKGETRTDTFQLLYEFHEHTEIDQKLHYPAPSGLAAWRYVKILTTQSPSWVSWKEVAIHKRDATTVTDDKSDIPQSFALLPNYPNPFNSRTVIRYHLPAAGHVKLCIFNTLGQRVRTLADSYRPAGRYKTGWNGKNAAGITLPGGVYFYRLETAGYSQTRKLLLLD